MNEFFKYFGIAICVILADIVFCVLIWFIRGDSFEDDDWWIGTSIVNVIGFAVVTAILIGERIG